MTELHDQLVDARAANAALQERLRVVEAGLVAAREALQRILANAEDWHGPPPTETGHVRALAVIATWASEALAALVPDTEAKP